jgi:hypothetical protein
MTADFIGSLCIALGAFAILGLLEKQEFLILNDIFEIGT